MTLSSGYDYNIPTKIGKGWKVKRETEAAIQCSLIKSPIVFIEPIPRYKMELLINKYPHQEWIGYLIGRVSEKENYFVEDLSIPPHKEVSRTSAEAEPFHIPDGCIGIIHSHNTMGAFHSATDQAYVDKNFPISITVSKKNQNLEFDTVSYQITPCGKGTTIKGQVKYVQSEPPIDSKLFMQEAITNIDKGRIVHSVQVHYPQSYPYRRPMYQHYPQKDYVIGENGEIMTQRELDAHLKEIWGDDL